MKKNSPKEIQKVGVVAEQEKAIFAEIVSTITAVREVVQNTPIDLAEATKILQKVRQCAYESLNQLQHEALLLRAMRYFESLPDWPTTTIEWQWHPRQTYGKNEPDLRAITSDGEILLLAEATTSIKARGTISARMKNTIHQLHEMTGSAKKYYIVSNSSMGNAAVRFIEKSCLTDLPITVEVIHLP